MQPDGGISSMTHLVEPLQQTLISDGSSVRIVGAYGVSGSNCVNFIFFPNRTKAESLLNEFMSFQAEVSDRKGLHMIVAGDTNSYPQPSIDHNGGP